MKIRLWFIKESTKARYYSKVPLTRNPQDSDKLWIPLSVVEHTSKDGNEHTVTLPDWFIESRGL
jgi:hypothetical protein